MGATLTPPGATVRKLTLTLMLLLVCALTGLGTGVVASAGTPGHPAAKGSPGKWTQVSTGSVGITDLSSLYRGPDGVLHIAYAKEVGAAGQIGHTAVSRTGKTLSQTDVLSPAWSSRVNDPVVLGAPSGALRIVFGGQQTVDPGYWSDGRMYESLGSATGTSWSLPASAIGLSNSAYGSYGTAAVTLADGTPVAAYVLNGDLVWHVGESETDADQTYSFPACCLYSTAMVRQGNDVWVAWYANGGSADTNGTFVKQILPTVGPTVKAPKSSVGVDSVPTGRVALTARTGGGVYAAYCVGYPNCSHIGLWKVGTSTVKAVPHSKYASTIALAAAPAGRMWLTWGNNIPTIQAVRTSKSGKGLGPVRKVGMPKGKAAVYTVSADGATGRGDIVINVGDGFWHTQVYAALKVAAKPGAWTHGRSHKVTFKVTDAGDAVKGAKVKVGSAHCKTSSSGKCSITFARSFAPGKHTVVASLKDYAKGKTKVRVH